MCAVSAVTDYYRDKWVQPFNLSMFQPTILPLSPTFVLKPNVEISTEQWAEYQELKRRMEAYDAETNQPDCIKPEVAVWEKVVAAIVK